jgi:cytoskeletal protein CcmA (bactofilin family)
LKKNHVTIGKTGRIKADVNGRSITIEGEVEGNLLGEKKIVLRPSGRVRGDMRAPAINLEEGAKFKGNIAMEAWDEKQPTLKEVPLAQDRNAPAKS